MTLIKKIRSIKYLRNEDGAAMIVVLCVMTLIMAVCLSLLLASYQMFTTASDDAKDDIYYHQALSSSMAIQKELVKNSRLKPSSASTIDDYIYYFMANTANYPPPYIVTLNQLSKSGTNSDAYGNATITLEKMDNGSGQWGDDYNCLCFVTVKITDETGEKVFSVTTKYLVTCENASYTYTASITDNTTGTVYENQIYNFTNRYLVCSNGNIPEAARRIAYSVAEGNYGILDNYGSGACNIKITRTRTDNSKYTFRFLERL